MFGPLVVRVDMICSISAGSLADGYSVSVHLNYVLRLILLRRICISENAMPENNYHYNLLVQKSYMLLLADYLYLNQDALIHST